MTAIFERKGEYLGGYQADWLGWIGDVRASWDGVGRQPTWSPS